MEELQAAQQVVENHGDVLLVEVALGSEVDELLQVRAEVSLHKEDGLDVLGRLALGNDDIDELGREVGAVDLLCFRYRLHKLDLTDKLNTVVVVLGEVLHKLDGNGCLGTSAEAFDNLAVASFADESSKLVKLTNVVPDGS